MGERIRAAMHGALRITPGIQWLEPGTLERAHHKVHLIEKRYEEEAG